MRFLLVLAFLTSVIFANGSKEFLKSYADSCEQQAGGIEYREYCICMAQSVLNRLSDEERALLNERAVTPSNAQKIQKLQAKILQLSLDEQIIYSCAD
ncbi:MULTISPECIES: hypothetical protein [Campylobacter]|nr:MULTISPECIES: hypothetical protein [Campylobacter]MBS4275910.1 hypothetical protein [Campylobacter vulpis]MBS4306446.1 hypothetical protein [Campylobacter vulpis]MBS4330067.1 hypothetical protein [Campylobacter vulpis]MBS4423366.1 hypothetical protein [Campylobacter vulpis]MCR2099296.1 hypothetical protein [Campylobacter upsaliensis]